VMPATAFEKIVNRVLFPIMSQVQDERDRLAGAYERALAVVALVSLPVSAVLWVMAPELIPALLGPRWTAVVLPFRLFTIGLFFRMSSKITDACVKAAGAVYSRAAIQAMYAVMVLLAALAGQRWGVGGVAVAVSVAMGINWLMMSALGRVVTGLSWPRFLRAQLPGAIFAVFFGVAVFVTVQATRAAHLRTLPVLIAGGLAAAAVFLASWRLAGVQLLGPHGMWVSRRVEELFRRITKQRPRSAVTSDDLASAEKARF